MTTRNLSLTLQQARELYKAYPDLKDLLLPSFPELDSKVVDKWEDLGTINGYYVKFDSTIVHSSTLSIIHENKNVFATEKQAKSSLAAAQLSQLMLATGDCDVVWSGFPTKPRHVIRRLNNKIDIAPVYDTYYFLAFNTEAIRDEFLTKYEDLIKQYFEL